MGYDAGLKLGLKMGVNPDAVFRTCDALVRRIKDLESQLINEAALEPVTNYKEESDNYCHELAKLVNAARKAAEEATSSEDSCFDSQESL